jgi:hypothetical protein
MDNLNWIKEIDYRKHLTDDAALIVDECGIDTYIKLTEIFSKTRIYFSTDPILEMKKEYIKKNFGKNSLRELTRILGVSEEFVRRAIKK